jgi:hypothetical protein
MIANPFPRKERFERRSILAPEVTPTRCPASASEEATLTPLPPGLEWSASTRFTAPAVKRGIVTVRSIAGFSVTVITS